MAGIESIDVVREGDRTRLILPARDLGVLRFGGIFAILFGTVFSGFAVFWMAAASGLIWGQFHWFSAIFALFGLPFFVVGLGIIKVGLFVLLPGNTEVVVTPEELVEVERAGIFRWRSRVKAGKVTKLRVMQGRTNQKGWVEIEVAGKGRTRKWATGYGDDVLKKLADGIRGEMGRFGASSILRAGEDGPGDTSAPAVEMAEVPPSDEEKRAGMVVEYARDDQPADSLVQFAEMPGGMGITFVKPKSGFRGGAAFFLMFSLVWTGISGTVFIGFLISFVGNFQWDKLLPLGFIAIFLAIGAFIFAVAIQLAFSRSVLVATRAGLVFTTKGPFRASEWQVDAGDVVRIVAGPSGTTINDKPLLQVQVHLRSTGKHKGMFTGLGDEELFWIATRLRTFYAIVPAGDGVISPSAAE